MMESNQRRSVVTSGQVDYPLRKLRLCEANEQMRRKRSRFSHRSDNKNSDSNKDNSDTSSKPVARIHICAKSSDYFETTTASQQQALTNSSNMFNTFTITSLHISGRFRGTLCIKRLENQELATMTTMTTMKRMAARSSASRQLYHPKLSLSLLLLALLALALNTQTALSSDSDASSSSLSASSSPEQAAKQTSIDRSSESPSLTATSSQKQPNSIIASLSSAVASAAAATAVAAAQSSLTGGDARSLLSASSAGSHASSIGGSNSNNHNNHNNHHNHHHRPGLNLAIKLADAIPEVPYSILHNMKKLDHAAPFYNVGNKLPGSGKESASLLASAFHSTASGLISAEQFSSLFRSPIWKRLADGYGEFTSEFRSLFKAAPTNMKGPIGASTGSKILRDISVPALLMLIASTIPSEWRPIRTRRKSLGVVPVGEQHAGADLLTSASAADLANLAPAQPQQLIARPQQQQFTFGAAPRFELSQELGQQNGWIQPTGSSQQAQHHLELVQPHPQLQAQTAHQQLIQPIRRRIGDDDSSDQLSSGLKPVNSIGGTGSSSVAAELAPHSMPPFGSLTSGLANIAARQGVASKRNDQLRYSLLPSSNENHDADLTALSSGGEQQKLSPPSKPFLLSAVSQGFGNLLNSLPLESGSQAATGAAAVDSFQTIGDKTVNHGSSLERFERRNQQQQQVNLVLEQRELSQILPQSWREAMKRTMSNVQQQASTQWRSIEGQLTNWVQGKLKALPVGAASSQSSSSSSAAIAAAPGAAPVANIIASVGSTAMSMLGLGSGSKQSISSASPVSQSANDLASSESSPTASIQTGDSHGASQKQPQSTKSALIGMANMLVSSLLPGAPSGSGGSGAGAPIRLKLHESQAGSSGPSQYPSVTSAQQAPAGV